MDRIGVVGVSWRQGGTDALARFTIPECDRDARLAEIAAETGARELVYIATCNRVEIAFVADGRHSIAAYRPRLFEALTGRAPSPGESERVLRAWAGEGAVEHLFLVAGGLDSARPGETEISGQFRDAFERSRRLGLLGARLSLVFEQALRVAARVHHATHIGEGRTSLAEIAIDFVRARLARTPGPLALVGVSPMTKRSARALAGGGQELVLVNRRVERARALAEETGAHVVALEDFARDPASVEAIVTATGSPDAVLTRATLERLAARSPSGEAPLVVDMAVPPDVDPEDAARVGVERVGMNRVIAIAEENRRERLVELADARSIVDEALDEIRRRVSERALAPVLAALQRRYRKTALEGVERLLRRELKGLGDEEQQAVRRWAETLARRFAHIPTMGLRGLSTEVGGEAVDAFLSSLDESLAAELRSEGELGRERDELLALPCDEEAAS